MRVAPHAGAWIETCNITRFVQYSFVAPHAGAWIETFKPNQHSHTVKVAPHAGAWIETLDIFAGPTNSPSLPTRERGLKLGVWLLFIGVLMSLPTRERGLKQTKREILTQFVLVAPHAGAWIETK